MNEQLEFVFTYNKPVSKRPKSLKYNIRIGKVSNLLFSSELNKILSPRGDGAREAYERDMSMSEFYEEDEYDY